MEVLGRRGRKIKIIKSGELAYVCGGEKKKVKKKKKKKRKEEIVWMKKKE